MSGALGVDDLNMVAHAEQDVAVGSHGNAIGRAVQTDSRQLDPIDIVYHYRFIARNVALLIRPHGKGRHFVETGIELSRLFKDDLVTSWYRPSMSVDGFCGCCNPVHIAFRDDGSLVTGEKGLARVKLYDVTGTFAGLVAGADSFPEARVASLSCDEDTPVQDLAVDARNRVLVLDPYDKSVRIFEEKETV